MRMKTIMNRGGGLRGDSPSLSAGTLVGGK